MRIWSFILILSVVSTGILHAQKIPFHNYTVENGLPSNVVYDIEQDQKGYLWFGTQGGAVRFDGYNFVTYDVNSGLPGNMIKEVFIDKQDNVWLGTRNEGLAIITHSGIQTISVDDGLLSNSIKFIFQDSIWNIWCISYEGISIIKPDTILNYSKENSPFKNTVLDYYVATNGTVFIGSQDGVFTYNNEFTPYRYNELGHLQVHDITEDRPGSYWFATENSGVINYNEQRGFDIYQLNSKINPNFAISICKTNDRNILVGTPSGGIYKIISDNIIEIWPEKNIDYLIRSLYIDRQNRAWAIAISNGIIQIIGNSARNITESNNLVFDIPTRIFEDANGNIWIGTRNGISMFGKTIFEQFNTGLLNDDKNVISIEYHAGEVYIGSYNGYNILNQNFDINSHVIKNEKGDLYAAFSSLSDHDNIWVGTTGGIIQIKDRVVKNHASSIMRTNYASSSAFDLAKSKNTIYAATENGLVTFRNGTFKKIHNNENYNQLYSIAIDSLKNVWCGSANGLSIYDGDQFHNYSVDDGLPDNFCNDIAFDNSGSAWVATDNGLSNISISENWDITCNNIGTQQGLTSGLAYLVTVDQQDNIWIGHNKGLDKFNPKTKKFTHYGKAEGFLPIETSLGAVSHGENGEIWFGTVDGAIRYLPENDYIYTDPPLVYITDVQLYGDSVPINNYVDSVDLKTNLPVNLKLKYNQNNLVFNYVGLHYTIVEKNTYNYILEGYDTEWSEITTDIETPPYRKVPHGKYTFKVRAANCDGVWTSSPAEFSFTIQPPFWKTLGFYMLEGILGVLLFWGIMYYRLRRLKIEKERLAQKVKERTIEVEKQRDQIVQQKKEITDSIQYAEKIQRAVLPTTSFVEEILPEHFVLFKPRDIVSGDFYWINREGNKVVVVAADCTGHGVPGAFMSMLGVSILNEIASVGEIPNANEILDTLREHLTSTLQQTGEESDAKDGMDLCLIVLDTKTKKLQFAGAYNPLIQVRNQEPTVYKGDKMPVGFHFGAMNPFTCQEIKVEKGDCLYLFSDGYADQFGGPDGKKFKSAKLRELLCEISPLKMGEQKDKLDSIIEEWMKEEDQIDDILIIGIRI